MHMIGLVGKLVALLALTEKSVANGLASKYASCQGVNACPCLNGLGSFSMQASQDVCDAKTN